MPELLKPDICVIGAGSGGLSVAAAAAAFGVPVVLVEKGRMGGDCLNFGCVPSKSLIASAKHARAIAQAPAFGVSASGAEVAYGDVHRHVHEVIAAIAPIDSKERFGGLGVRVIEGTARFKDKRTVVVANETVFDLTTRPEHLLVIGAGPIGLELAQAFRRLGSKVTVVEAAQPLAREDPECAAIVLDALAREGIEIRAGAEVVRVEAAGAGIKMIVRMPAGEQAIEGSHLLVAAGRRANAAGLDLENAAIRYDGGGIKVDKGMRTTNKRVYAIGDVAGGPQFTHAANYHAGLVIRSALFRLRVAADDDLIPRVTFTDPELAQIGLTEAEARRRRIDFRVLRWPYHENDRAQAERETTGHIKVVTDRKGGILGATIVGAAAGELITTWTLAISQGLNIRALTGIVVPYPTLSEVGKRAAITYFTPGLTSPWVRRIIAVLRRFG
jgi:pyruvate/2-oxoglutarate dehydrogenase complex dihydrolipoamide dehydrogenase (E3) component